MTRSNARPTTTDPDAPAVRVATAERLLELRVSERIATWPETLQVRIDAGFAPLAYAPLRATLAPTVTLRLRRGRKA